MPIWAPPTPPQEENDLYIDYSLGFLYEQNIMPESQLPPVYIPKESNKRLKLDTTIARKQKVRKEEGFNIPRSLFDRPSTAIIKLRRELILQKMKGTALCGPENAAIHRTLNSLGASCLLPQTNAMPSPNHKAAQVFSGPLQDSIPNWAIHEDWAILQVIQYFQDLPLNLLNISPGHVPNWDLVSDVVNLISCNFRSAKLCKFHYEGSIVAREEGKAVNETTPKPKQKKIKGVATTPVTNTTTTTASTSATPAVTPPAVNSKPTPNLVTTRPIKTSQLIAQDNNISFSQLCNQRFETIKQIANKRTPTLKHMFINPTAKNPKHIALLSESGINYEQPLTPIQVAVNRAERISREKQKVVAEQQLAANRLQHQMQHKQQTTQIKTILSQNNAIPTAQHQLSQAISAKMSALNQSTLNKGATASGMASNASVSSAATHLNITKALSQVNVASQSLPQPILSQINVSPQTIGSTTVTNAEGLPQSIQQTCSVVSVAALTPQAHQKLIAAVSPAVGQIGSQSLANRLTTTNPQIYKQIILRQQQQQIQRQQHSPHIQMQTIPQTAKQMTNLGVGQQQPRFQITATVAQQPIQHTQSLIATAGLKASAPSIVTTLPVAVPMTGTQQRITTSTTSTGKPTQQIITRTITDPLQMAQIIKRQQLVSQQSSGNLGQTQILVQQSASHSTQSSQSQTQLLQNPVTFVKTLSSPATLATQSLTIPITMTGMNIFTSPVTKVVSPTASNNPTTSAITSVPATQLRQHIQLLQQKRPQQTTQVLQQQQLQSQLSQQLGQQNQQKITTATIGGQTKGMAQIQTSPVGTFQILHQSSPTGQGGQSSKPTTVTVQQLQQVQQALLSKGLVMPHNLTHTIHVSQSATNTTSAATLIPQSLLQTVSQTKTSQTSQIESSQQSTPIAVAQIGPNQQTVKHIQVVSSASPQSQSSGSVAPKSIIISGQPTILQTTSLQSQPQTVTFAIRAAQSTSSPQTQTISSLTTSTAQTTEVPNTTTVAGVDREVEPKELMDGNQSNVSQSQSRQSPYATRQRNTKS